MARVQSEGDCGPSGVVMSDNRSTFSVNLEVLVWESQCASVSLGKPVRESEFGNTSARG